MYLSFSLRHCGTSERVVDNHSERTKWGTTCYGGGKFSRMRAIGSVRCCLVAAPPSSDLFPLAVFHYIAVM